MQKAKIKLYVKGKRRALFSCEIADDAENVLANLDDKLNDTASETVRFGQVCFKREDFRYYEIEYR